MFDSYGCDMAKRSMGKNRSWMEIVSLILGTAAVGEGATKTKLMYRSYLSFPQLQRYLLLLLENDLLEGHGDAEQQIYKITEKGIRFLEISRDIDSLFHPKIFQYNASTQA